MVERLRHSIGRTLLVGDCVTRCEGGSVVGCTFGIGGTSASGTVGLRLGEEDRAIATRVGSVIVEGIGAGRGPLVGETKAA